MASKNQIMRPTVNSINSYVGEHAAQVEEAQKHQHPISETVREADYEGHHIIVRTTYEIEVDGIQVTGHMGVTNDGQVHYHPIPNMSFASALDMVKQLIDVFPDDFTDTRDMTEEHGDHVSADKPHKKSGSTASRVKKTHTDHE